MSEKRSAVGDASRDGADLRSRLSHQLDSRAGTENLRETATLTRRNLWVPQVQKCSVPERTGHLHMSLSSTITV